MKVLPNNVFRVIKDKDLLDKWQAYHEFCQDNSFRPRDIWVGFFILAIKEGWVTEELVQSHLDSIALEIYQSVKKLSYFVEEVNLNFESLSAQVYGRPFLIQAVGNPRSVLIYCTTLYRRLLMKDEQVFNPTFARKIQVLLAPLCISLNFGFIKWRLEDMAFKILEPEAYHNLSRQMDLTRKDREQLVKQMTKSLSVLCDSRGILVDHIAGRAKHLYGIYRKMVRKHVNSYSIYDKVALRVVCQNVNDCYTVCKLLGEQYPVISDEYNDYISMPKENGYQSLHLAIYYNDVPIEIQIKTIDMHQFNQYGPAAHWLYKDQQAFTGKVSRVLSQVDFQDVIKNKIFVLTPEGDIVSLPKGAMPLDFAYAVHSEVGHRCVGALVNDKMTSLSQPLKTGVTVKVLTRRGAHPTADWLTGSYTKTQSARRHIRNFLRKHFDYDATPVKAHKLPAEKLLRKGQDDTQVQRKKANFKNMGMIAHHIAKCCQPIKPELIVGYITRSRGMSVHKAQCKNILELDEVSKLRVQQLSWDGLGMTSSQLVVECVMDCGRVTREAVIQTLKSILVSADWYTDERDGDLARLRCVLQLEDADKYFQIEKDLLSITGVISFGKI